MSWLPKLLQWHWDTYTDDLGEHRRAVKEINGKEVCVVNTVGSKWFTVFVGEAVSLVREDKLEKWINNHLTE